MVRIIRILQMNDLKIIGREKALFSSDTKLLSKELGEITQSSDFLLSVELDLLAKLWSKKFSSVILNYSML